MPILEVSALAFSSFHSALITLVILYNSTALNKMYMITFHFNSRWWELLSFPTLRSCMIVYPKRQDLLLCDTTVSLMKANRYMTRSNTQTTVRDMKHHSKELKVTAFLHISSFLEVPFISLQNYQSSLILVWYYEPLCCYQTSAMAAGHSFLGSVDHIGMRRE